MVRVKSILLFVLPIVAEYRKWQMIFTVFRTSCNRLYDTYSAVKLECIHKGPVTRVPHRPSHEKRMPFFGIR